MIQSAGVGLGDAGLKSADLLQLSSVSYVICAVVVAEGFRDTR
jgi:hypothetical protein